jgi:hypothetical protein
MSNEQQSQEDAIIIDFLEPYHPHLLMNWILTKVPNNSWLFGEVGVGPRLPKVSSDGRVLTWSKLIDMYTNQKLINNPQSTKWCWFVQENHKAGGSSQTRSCMHKLSKNGTGNQLVLVSVMFFLKPYNEYILDMMLVDYFTC